MRPGKRKSARHAARAAAVERMSRVLGRRPARAYGRLLPAIRRHGRAKRRLRRPRSAAPAPRRAHAPDRRGTTRQRRRATRHRRAPPEGATANPSPFRRCGPQGRLSSSPFVVTSAARPNDPSTDFAGAPSRRTDRIFFQRPCVTGRPARARCRCSPARRAPCDGPWRPTHRDGRQPPAACSRPAGAFRPPAWCPSAARPGPARPSRFCR